MRQNQKIANPFCDLTNKKSLWKWVFRQQKAFEILKISFTPPVLKQADGTKPYIVRTDANDYSLGAVYFKRLIKPSFLKKKNQFLED
ncbi:hypothetical protein CEXT_749341 [Caerostris extrusa]|uniref:Reverse transcriptase/retrotransposon-derived protein RNase H-like domain-containing protein n=1 Tax=Caerostris extrusa TaxID=172846 RepID=A0AAV4QRU6_CAEEX|nr:hypothetical protein CEXT_749341 [Caerostris extrusa]